MESRQRLNCHCTCIITALSNRLLRWRSLHVKGSFANQIRCSSIDILTDSVCVFSNSTGLTWWTQLLYVEWRQKHVALWRVAVPLRLVWPLLKTTLGSLEVWLTLAATKRWEGRHLGEKIARLARLKENWTREAIRTRTKICLVGAKPLFRLFSSWALPTQ